MSLQNFKIDILLSIWIVFTLKKFNPQFVAYLHFNSWEIHLSTLKTILTRKIFFFKMSLAIILLGVLFAWIVVKHYYYSFQFPPGLPRLPVVGTVPFLRGETGSRVLLSSVNLIPKYGDIIGYFMGPTIKWDCDGSFKNYLQFLLLNTVFFPCWKSLNQPDKIHYWNLNICC